MELAASPGKFAITLLIGLTMPEFTLISIDSRYRAMENKVIADTLESAIEYVESMLEIDNAFTGNHQTLVYNKDGILLQRVKK